MSIYSRSAITLNQLRYASAVASTGSFGRAAKLCHVAQSTLSQAVAQLETELGAPLFERNTRRVALSSFGRHVLACVDQVLADVGDLQTTASNYLDPNVKILRIGLSPVVDMRLVSDVLEPFQRHHPQMRIFYKQCFLSDLEERLRNGQIDIVLAPMVNTFDIPSLACTPLYDEPLMFLPCAGREIAVQGNGPRATISNLAGETFVLTPDICGLVRATRALFRAAGIRLREYPGQAVSYDVMQEWADLGIGAAILPASKLRPEGAGKATPLQGDDGRSLVLPVAAHWNSALAATPHVEALREHLVSAVPTLVGNTIP